MDLAPAYDQKCPLRQLVLNTTDVRLVWTLGLSILEGNAFSNDRRMYIDAKIWQYKPDVVDLTHTKTIAKFILHSWLCWGLTSQSTIFQSYRDGAIASWVINQYFRGVKCLAQGHNTAAVGLEPRTSQV